MRVLTGFDLGASTTWTSDRFADVTALDGAPVPLLDGALSFAFAKLKALLRKAAARARKTFWSTIG
ncbi:hypothetical protein [Roseomonas sp. WA12]